MVHVTGKLITDNLNYQLWETQKRFGRKSQPTAFRLLIEEKLFSSRSISSHQNRPVGELHLQIRLGELQASGKATRQMISRRCIGTCMCRRLAYIYHKQFPLLGIYRIRYCSHGSNQTSACKRTSFALLRLVVAKWLKRHGTKQGNSRSWGIWFRPVEGTEYSKWKSLRIKKFEGKFWDDVNTCAENFCQNYTMYLWNSHYLFVCYCFTIMRKIYDWLITFRC